MLASEFFTKEFSALHLKDTRLVKRAIVMGNTLLRSPGSCIQELFDSKNEARCAYDFLSNPKVQWLHLFQAHQAQTLQRIQISPTPYLYLIQDSTFYNYTAHKANVDIGTIGQQGRFTPFGFLQHTALCVSGEDIPLGLLELDFMGYEDDVKSSAHRQGFNALASSRWRRFLAQAHTKLQGIKKNIILLCDREADFFELLYEASELSFPFIIRSKWDRPTGPSGRARQHKFSQLLSNIPPLGAVSLKLINPHTHHEEQRVFQLKALSQVTLPAIHRGAGHPQNKLPPILINLVEASDGQDRWVLLTNLG